MKMKAGHAVVLTVGIYGREADVFEAETDADQAGRDEAKIGEALKELKEPGSVSGLELPRTRRITLFWMMS